MENEKSEREQSEKDLIDETADKVVAMLGNHRPIRIIRRSQILSAVLGAIGFALFIDGIIKLFADWPAAISLLAGLILLLVTGLLIKNLNR